MGSGLTWRTPLTVRFIHDEAIVPPPFFVQPVDRSVFFSSATFRIPASVSSSVRGNFFCGGALPGVTQKQSKEGCTRPYHAVAVAAFQNLARSRGTGVCKPPSTNSHSTPRGTNVGKQFRSLGLKNMYIRRKHCCCKQT